MAPPVAQPGVNPTFPWVTLLAGLSSGLLSTLLLQPLDVAKTSLINPHERSSGVLALFRQIRGEAGWTGLWRGVGPALVRISIGSGVYFTTQTQLLTLIRRRMQAEGLAPDAPLSSTSLLTVGFLSRASAVSVCCPISVVKTRIEGNAVKPYASLWDGLRTIQQREGVRGLYTGLLPSVLKDSPFSAVYLFCYSRLKSQFVRWDRQLHFLSPAPASGVEAWSDARLAGHPVIQFNAAFIGGGLATALFQPTEVIKTRLQLDTATLATRSTDAAASAATSNAAAPAASSVSASSAAAPRHRVWSMAVRIHREDGARGFFRGLAPRIIKRSLSTACGWMIFEQLVQFWSGTTGL